MANPFETFLDPSRQGTLGGFLGGVVGSPTAQQRAGQASGQGLQQFQSLVEKTGSPQKALLEFMNTPQGQEMFMRNPDAIKQLADFKALGEMKKFQLNPGDMLADEKGNVLRSNPTQQAQTFQHMASLAGLDGETLKEVAQVQLMPNSTEKERAAQRLKAKRPDIAEALDMLATGALVVSEEKDRFGNATGRKIVINMLDRTSVTGVTDPTSNDPSQLSPRPAPPPEDPNARQPEWTPKNSMFFGSGIVPQLARAGQRVVGQFGGVMESGVLVEEQRKALEAVRYSLMSLSDGKGGIGIPKAQQEQALKLFADMSNWQDSLTAVKAGQSLLKMAEDQIAFNESIEVNPNYAKRERENASSRRVNWERVRMTLPSMQEMRMAERFARNYELEGGPPRVTAGGVYGESKKALRKSYGTLQHEMGVPGGMSDGAPTMTGEPQTGIPRSNPNLKPNCREEFGQVFCRDEQGRWLRQ